MTERRILVTGATGETGSKTVESLRERGANVRALVHEEDARSERLRSLGAEVVVGDLLELDDVHNALQGVSSAYFVYPIRPGLIAASTYFAQAAREIGVGAIVNMSQIQARRETKSHATRDHWIGERIFDGSGIPVTHLRPTLFAQWLLYPQFREPMMEHGVMRFPFGQGRHAPIAAEDQGRLIAEILLKPEPHRGKIYRLFGPVEMDHHGIAKAMSEVLGRTITYEPISIEVFQRQIASFPPVLVQHLGAMALDYQNGLFEGTDDVIAKITGRAPMTVQQFVALHRDLFATPAARSPR